MRFSVVILLFLFAFLSACGFEPVYKNQDVSNFSITTPKNKFGYLLKQNLENILYLDSDHALTVGKIGYAKKVATLEENRQRTRYDIKVYTDYVLTKNGKEIKAGKANSITSYNVVDDDYSTYVAEEDAIKRAIREMAEDIRGQIIFAK